MNFGSCVTLGNLCFIAIDRIDLSVIVVQNCHPPDLANDKLQEVEAPKQNHVTTIPLYFNDTRLSFGNAVGHPSENSKLRTSGNTLATFLETT